MIGSVIGALVVGLIGVFAIVISQGIISGQNTTGWPTVLTSIMTNISPVIGIVAIIAMFIIIVRLAGGFGGGTTGA
jgi:tetrahydromethanopterin S-methyltransferase subunit E